MSSNRSNMTRLMDAYHRNGCVSLFLFISLSCRCCLTATASETADPGAGPLPAASVPGNAAARGPSRRPPATPTAAGLALAPGDLARGGRG